MGGPAPHLRRGRGVRRALQFGIPEKRPLPSPTAFAAFRVGQAPTLKCGGHPLPQQRKVMTFSGCALAPRSAGPAAPPSHTPHWEGVGGEGVWSSLRGGPSMCVVGGGARGRVA